MSTQCTNQPITNYYIYLLTFTYFHFHQPRTVCNVYDLMMTLDLYNLCTAMHHTRNKKFKN